MIGRTLRELETDHPPKLLMVPGSFELPHDILEGHAIRRRTSPGVGVQFRQLGFHSVVEQGDPVVEQRREGAGNEGAEIKRSV